MSRPQPNTYRPITQLLAGAREATDQFMAGPHDPETDALPDSRRGRRLLWLDGLVSNISESFVTNFVNPFALALGANNSQIGVLSALTNLGAALALFPGARLAERSTHRKPIVVWTGGIAARLALIALAAAPLIFRGHAAIYAFIALVALRAFAGQLGYPAWSAMLADLVPAGIRGRYFASRNIALAAAALIFTPLAGRLAETIGLPHGYQASFLVAGLVGFAATLIFARIPEPQPQISGPAAGSAEGVGSILRRHPRFAAFTAVAFLWNLSLMVAGPFFSVYVVVNLGASPTQIGLLAAANSVTNIIGQRLWGRLNDHHGPSWVIRVTGMFIPLVPLLYAFATDAWFLVPVEILSGFLWSGYGLASFNLLLSLAPPAQRARFSAIYQMAVFSPAVVGPLLGSVAANTIGIRPLFFLSTAGRFLAAILFMVTVRGDQEQA